MTLETYLDRLVRPTVLVLKRKWHVFRLCGYCGLLASILLTLSLIFSQSLSPWVLAGMVLVGVGTFLALAMITKIILGEEQLVYYHHEIAIIVVVALFLWLMGQPILPYLDVAILGIGAFLVFGRVGCLMVGCCHGRPHRWGVCYGRDHAEAGFTSCYVGTRLFPIQLVESMTVLVVVVVGTIMVVWGWPAGSALTWYVMSYDTARFFFEFRRGDPGRRYLKGFSEAQWTSVLLMVLVVVLEVYGVLPFAWWHVVVTGLLALMLAAVAIQRGANKSVDYRLFLPRHLTEFAEAVQLVRGLHNQEQRLTDDSGAQHIDIASTSQGVCVSMDVVHAESRCVRHYTLSREHGPLSAGTAEALAQFIIQLHHPRQPYEMVGSDRGIFHVLVSEPDPMTTGVRDDDELAGAAPMIGKD